MIIGNKEFLDCGHTYVMGILNVTPDSFSDGGKFNNIDNALFHTEEMIMQGADIIDVGGESTRPGYEKISDEEEISRVAPVIEAINERFDTIISLDTYKSAVAKAGIASGAHLINDIWGLKADKNMASIIADNNVSCCIMHNRDNMNYVNLIQDIKSDLSESIRLAKNAGINDDRIMLDPGVGFAKSYEDNLQAIAQMKEYKDLGYPVLLGTSRKSVIGLTLDLPACERLEGTLATTALAVMNGISYVRVHDVASNVRMIKMLEKILEYA